MSEIKMIRDGNGTIIGSQRDDGWIVDRGGHQIARQVSGRTVTVDGQRYGTGDQRIGALKELGNKKK